MSEATPRIVDNDRDEITAMLNGMEIRGWSYENEAERRVKIQMAHEFAEGWYQAVKSQLANLDPDANKVFAAARSALSKAGAV